ncbi:MAG: hypothetical protein ACE5OP_10065 [Candidatus Glassbacteria bacterium]
MDIIATPTRMMILLAAFFTACSLPGFHTRKSEGEGIGILETDDISVVLEGEGIWLRITPIDESILKYCTEDTRAMYNTILKTHPEISEGLKGKIFLMHFQGRTEPETYFEPTEVEILHQGGRYRPLRIIPHTPDFDKRVLAFFGNPQMAIYIFSEEIDFEFPITFRYKTLENRNWDQIIERVKDAKTKY